MKGHSTSRIDYLRVFGADVAKRRHFSLTLNEPGRVNLRSERDDLAALFAELYTPLVRPLLALASECWIHDIDRLGDPTRIGAEFEQSEAMEEHWRGAFLERVDADARVNLDAPEILDDRLFWWWVIRSGTRPVLRIDRGRLDIGALFPLLYDPVCVTNLRKIRSGSAQRRLNALSRRGDLACVVDWMPYKIVVTWFAKAPELLALFEAAVAQARLTPQFRTQFAPWLVPET